MGIFRSTNPAEFDDVDGIIINESAPAPNVAGVAANTAILVGQFERGPVNELTLVGSIGELHELFGKSSAKGNLALKNKRFGMLKVVRAAAAAAAKATLSASSSATPRISFTAKYVGAYGNSIKVTIAAGSSAGKKYTFQDTSDDAVLPAEVYDNVEIASVGSTFSGSRLVDVAVLSSAAEPDNQAATSLASGSDGTIADGDYEDAIAVTEVEGAGNILFLDEYTATRNGYLKTSMANTQDKMAIICGAEGDNRAAAVADVASYRDSDGRLIYAYPWVKTSIDGVDTYTQPAAWMASLLSQIAPNIDPAYAKNTQYLAGMTGLKFSLSRADYIALKDAGISAFENDQDIGFKVKSGVVTQIADSSKIMVARRRMADYLTASVARYLKNFQNAPNTKANRTAVKAAILAFIESNESDGMLPRDSDVKSGLAKLVDTESLNTDLTIAQGYFKILWKQRIHSSMRFIVIQAEIGESVVVTENS
jgi:hypothetical protein